MIFLPTLLALCLDFSLTSRYIDYQADTFWDKQGHSHDAHTDFHKYAGELAGIGYFEEGYVSAKGSFCQVRDRLSGNQTGFSDVEVAAGWNLTPKWTLQTIAIVPTGGYEPAIRYGEWGVEGNVGYLKRFCLAEFDLFAGARAGYRWYHGFPSDQIIADGIIGIKPTECIEIALSARLEWGVYNGQEKLNESLFLLAPNYRLLKTELFGSWAATEIISLYAGGYLHAWGQNVGKGGGWYGGFWLDF